ncbi:hypothetical protein KI387_021649, partial [Taxus chinensis]
VSCANDTLKTWAKTWYLGRETLREIADWEVVKEGFVKNFTSETQDDNLVMPLSTRMVWEDKLHKICDDEDYSVNRLFAEDGVDSLTLRTMIGMRYDIRRQVYDFIEYRFQRCKLLNRERSFISSTWNNCIVVGALQLPLTFMARKYLTTILIWIGLSAMRCYSLQLALDGFVLILQLVKFCPPLKMQSHPKEYPNGFLNLLSGTQQIDSPLSILCLSKERQLFSIEKCRYLADSSTEVLQTVFLNFTESVY